MRQQSEDAVVHFCFVIRALYARRGRFSTVLFQ